jgi:hypothetical protein
MLRLNPDHESMAIVIPTHAVQCSREQHAPPTEGEHRALF